MTTIAPAGALIPFYREDFEVADPRGYDLPEIAASSVSTPITYDPDDPGSGGFDGADLTTLLSPSWKFIPEHDGVILIDTFLSEGTAPIPDGGLLGTSIWAGRYGPESDLVAAGFGVGVDGQPARGDRAPWDLRYWCAVRVHQGEPVYIKVFGYVSLDQSSFEPVQLVVRVSQNLPSAPPLEPTSWAIRSAELELDSTGPGVIPYTSGPNPTRLPRHLEPEDLGGAEVGQFSGGTTTQFSYGGSGFFNFNWYKRYGAGSGIEGPPPYPDDSRPNTRAEIRPMLGTLWNYARKAIRTRYHGVLWNQVIDLPAALEETRPGAPRTGGLPSSGYQTPPCVVGWAAGYGSSTFSTNLVRWNASADHAYGWATVDLRGVRLRAQSIAGEKWDDLPPVEGYTVESFFTTEGSIFIAANEAVDQSDAYEGGDLTTSLTWASKVTNLPDQRLDWYIGVSRRCPLNQPPPNAWGLYYQEEIVTRKFWTDGTPPEAVLADMQKITDTDHIGEWVELPPQLIEQAESIEVGPFPPAGLTLYCVAPESLNASPPEVVQNAAIGEFDTNQVTGDAYSSARCYQSLVLRVPVQQHYRYVPDSQNVELPPVEPFEPLQPELDLRPKRFRSVFC